MAGTKEHSGRKHDQKMKPFLIYQYLMRETDSEHFASTDDIKEYLFENFGIESERRSIYRDIQEINKTIIALREEISLEEAEALMGEDDECKPIRLWKRKGFYAAQRTYNEEDIRLLAECVYAAQFVDEKRAEKLANVVFQLVSTHQSERMNHRAIVKNRVKTSNTAVYYTVNTIHEAIGKGGSNSRKIKFQYLKHTLQDVKQQTKRKHGAYYIVTPYSLIIDNGNYYLLGFDESTHDLRTYRVDRMMRTRILNEYAPNDGRFEGIDLERYTKEHFGMFGGDLETVTLNCSARLLDAMIDRFGTDEVSYIPVSKSYFNIHVSVYVSDQFFGWVSGFGRQIQIVSPLSVREQYSEYLNKIAEWHSGSVKGVK